MKIGDEIMVRGFVDEIRQDVVIIRNAGGYFGTTANEVMPAARRGSWEVRPAPEEDRVLGRWRYYCSACGGWTSYGRSDFCPRCGAKMSKTEPSGYKMKPVEQDEPQTDCAWR